MSHLRSFNEITPDDVALVGGKGLSLGLMTRAGLPVPPGFCIVSAAYRAAREQRLLPEQTEAIQKAYLALGEGLVAVRSSATAEDGVETSFAGQQETILGVEGLESLREAIERCWRSLHTERAVAYRRKQGIDETGLAMAVVVQRLIPAEVAGVLFTRDPLDPSGELMLVEASWGLGEAVVSGKVTPDRFQVERKTGAVRSRTAGKKHIRITSQGEEQLPTDQHEMLCLSDEQLGALAELGRAVEAFYGDARDVEWAYAHGRFWLLQARPITTISAADRETVRRQEIDRLKQLADPAGTVWSRFNLIEVLPEPTPMTWSIVQHLLSGGGGSGKMYRELGFTPDPALESTTVYDLIGGRPYCNLSREPHLQARKPLFAYPFAKFKEQPHLALDPRPDTSRMLGGFWRFLRLPAVMWNLLRTVQRLQSGSKTFADEFRKQIIPGFMNDVAKAAVEDLSKLDNPALVERLRCWIHRTLVEFARHSLKPTVFANFAMQVLEKQLKPTLGDARTRQAIAELSAGAHADPEADLPHAICDLEAGKLDRATFLKRFGHRGSHEMELEHPRWSEDPSSLDRLVGTRSAGTVATIAALPPPLERWERWATEAKINSFISKSLATRVEQLQTYIGLRETGKHYLMHGYALIRSTLLELDRRYRLAGGIFFLTLEDMPELLAGKDMRSRVEERRKYRRVALGLDVPAVVFSDDLEAIGRPLPPPEGSSEVQGIPLSAGVVEGPALVLSEPISSDGIEPGYILVCPSTDPAWVPLFVHAKGLVMESGGALSHGAIVAREFGLPAVAGLPRIHQIIKNAQRIRVDGNRGSIVVLS